MKLDRGVGLGPKTLAEIVRFQNRFVSLTRFDSAAGSTDAEEDYYDQSHFSRELRRFSGLRPTACPRKGDEFMTMFYRRSGSRAGLKLRSARCHSSSWPANHDCHPEHPGHGPDEHLPLHEGQNPETRPVCFH